jgi:hypothetical protein
MTERQNLNESTQERFAQKYSDKTLTLPVLGSCSSDQKDQSKQFISSPEQENDNSKLINGCMSPNSFLAQNNK